MGCTVRPSNQETTMNAMTKFEVSAKTTGHIFGIFEADTPEAAIEACNRDAGYASTAHSDEVVGCDDGLIATEVA